MHPEMHRAFDEVVRGMDMARINAPSNLKDIETEWPRMNDAQSATIAALAERVMELERTLTYIDRQVREVWSPPHGDAYQGTHRLWCIDEATKVLNKMNTPEKLIGTGFYRDAAPGTFGPSEWLDLLMACQDGRATCMRAKEIIEREIEFQAPSIDRMVDAFLSWPLPDSVCPDLCALDRTYQHRVGTNLLTAIEAKQMIEYLLANGADQGARDATIAALTARAESAERALRDTQEQLATATTALARAEKENANYNELYHESDPRAWDANRLLSKIRAQSDRAEAAESALATATTELASVRAELGEARERVEELRGPNSFTADGYRLMSPDTQRALGEMVALVRLNEIKKDLGIAQEALASIAGLSTSQTAPDDQCSAVIIAMDALKAIRAAARPDAEKEGK